LSIQKSGLLVLEELVIDFAQAISYKSLYAHLRSEFTNFKFQEFHIISRLKGVFIQKIQFKAVELWIGE
jgi:hypothetical protein